MNNHKDIKQIDVKYLLSSGYRTKSFTFKAPQYRHDVVKLIDRIKAHHKVFQVTGYTLNGTYI